MPAFCLNIFIIILHIYNVFYILFYFNLRKPAEFLKWTSSILFFLDLSIVNYGKLKLVSKYYVNQVKLHGCSFFTAGLDNICWLQRLNFIGSETLLEGIGNPRGLGVKFGWVLHCTNIAKVILPLFSSFSGGWKPYIISGMSRHWSRTTDIL